MTIETVSRRAGPFTGDGSTTNFPFEFKVFSESQISVQSAEGDEAETTLTLGEDYSVTLNSDQDENPGGTVTLASALATDTRLSIISAIPSTQLVKVTNYDRFYPTTFNDEFDKLTGLIQQLEERADRAVTVDSTDTMTPAELKEKLVTAADTATVVAKGYADQAKASATAAAASETKTAEYATAAITIAPISEEVKTVAGAIDSVKTVSTNVASVKTVANNATTVKTVGDNITTVTTAAGLVPYASDLRAISPHTDDLHAVGQNISAVTTTSANISSVTTVAGNVASVKTVANNATTVKTVGDNIEAVKSATAILPYATDLTTISPHVDDLHAVGQDLLSASGGITPVATHLEDCIHPVVQKLSDIHAVGVIADKVTAVANAATAIDAINTNIDAVKFAGENIDSITSAAQIIDAHKADPSGHPVATQSSAGFMSAADKTKLDNFENLADGSVTTAKIADGAVTTAKLDSSVLSPYALKAGVFPKLGSTTMVGLGFTKAATATVVEFTQALYTKFKDAGSAPAVVHINYDNSAYGFVSDGTSTITVSGGLLFIAHMQDTSTATWRYFSCFYIPTAPVTNIAHMYVRREGGDPVGELRLLPFGASAVSYTSAQSTTATQKAQARSNIGLSEFYESVITTNGGTVPA